MQDAGCRMHGAGCRVQDVGGGKQMWEVGGGMQDVGCTVLAYSMTSEEYTAHVTDSPELAMVE
tara:strand:- start:181 stop:369 length:189 start_codon:yes stop_codon:yes gene_type:complete